MENKITPINDNDVIIAATKNKCEAWVNKMLNCEVTYTKPGSIAYLLFGKKPSEQSVLIKFGKFGELLAKELINNSPNFELLNCGVQKINDKNKDVDLLFMDKTTQMIYYRELKGNIELDTEKIPATIEKCKIIETSLKEKYPHCEIDCGILNWSVYNRKILTAGISNIKSFENKGVKVYHMEDFFHIIGIIWNENEYYEFYREIGQKITTKFS